MSSKFIASEALGSIVEVIGATESLKGALFGDLSKIPSHSGKFNPMRLSFLGDAQATQATAWYNDLAEVYEASQKKKLNQFMNWLVSHIKKAQEESYEVPPLDIPEVGGEVEIHVEVLDASRPTLTLKGNKMEKNPNTIPEIIRAQETVEVASHVTTEEESPATPEVVTPQEPETIQETPQVSQESTTDEPELSLEQQAAVAQAERAGLWSEIETKVSNVFDRLGDAPASMTTTGGKSEDSLLNTTAKVVGYTALGTVAVAGGILTAKYVASRFGI